MPGRKVLLLLDCCFSGAFDKGYQARMDGRADVELHNLRGRAVITSSTALEYAFELSPGVVDVTGSPSPSVFTTVVTEGLRSGDADLDHDGLVSVHDLYTYTRERVLEITPRQSPKMAFSGSEFFVAINPKLAQQRLVTPFSREVSSGKALSTPVTDGQTDYTEPYDDREVELVYWSRVVDAMRESAERTELASALSSKGAVLVGLRFYDEAVSPYEESAAICRDLGDYAGELLALISLIDVYDELRLTDDSAAASRRIVELRERSDGV